MTIEQKKSAITRQIEETEERITAEDVEKDEPSEITRQIEATEERIRAEDARTGHEAIMRQIEATRTRITADDVRNEGWSNNLVHNASGAVKSNLANCIRALTEAPAWEGILGWDLLQNQAVLFWQPPTFGPRAEPVDGRWRALTDIDVNVAMAWLQMAGVPSAGREDVRAALQVAARQHPFHPVRDRLQSVSWDNENRLDSWLIDYLGAEDTEYARLIGRMWLISAVARVMSPGCKVDHVLILEGPQGIGKSSACAILGGDYFGSDLPPFDDVIRQKMYLRGKWIIEVSELDSFNKADTSKLKSFITETEDRYIPKYGRQEVVEPRQCVFVGTTNDDHYIKDSTGGRRFWPARCGRIDLDGLAQARDQLFAEAVAAYYSGEEWWPHRGTEQKLITPQQEARFDADAWEEPVKKYLDDKLSEAMAQDRQAFVETVEVAEQALDLPKSRIGKSEQNRIGNVLRRAGWERRRLHGRRVWVPGLEKKGDGGDGLGDGR